ncbi:MAG: hypothetical protein ABIY55_09665, partial [Kofleriaceae bacterium]
ETARELLRLVRRDAGAAMPGLASPPRCELALPAREPGAYHLAHVLLDGAFLRFHPDGVDQAGVVYPIDDAAALLRLIAAAPAR